MRAIIVIVPKLSAAASPIISAGSSNIPWGSNAAKSKPTDSCFITVTETNEISQPLTVNASTGTRQRSGLKMKLKSRAEVFFRKMKAAVENLNGTSNFASSSITARSSAKRLTVSSGIARPKVMPVANNPTATRIHRR